MAEKKTPRKKQAQPAPAQPVPPAPVAAAPEAAKVIGPGVVKRPKRDPSAPPAPGDEPNYKPSEQVFRRRS